jgi:hypothetical protein
MKMSRRLTVEKIWIVTREEDGEIWNCAFKTQGAAEEHLLKVMQGSWASYGLDEDHGPLSDDLVDAREIFEAEHDYVSVKIEECPLLDSFESIPEVYYG